MSLRTGALRLVLGDQVSDRLSALRDVDPARDEVLMAEVVGEAARWRFHKQKIVLTFSAMRQFARRLEARGVAVRYVRIDDPASTGTLTGEVLRALTRGDFERVVTTEPGAFAVLEDLRTLDLASPVPLEIRPDDRFLCSRAEFEAWVKGRSGLRLETFYRWMRKRVGLLMDGDQPAGGQWNYDPENRKRPPKGLFVPPRRVVSPNAVTRQVMTEVADLFPDHFGTLEAFAWPTNAEDAEGVLQAFIDERLPLFGDYQDAMTTGEPFLWHAHIAPALNIGLIDPLDACRRAEAAWRTGRAPLNAVEGFIRQILGWREFTRAIYWRQGPAYKTLNALEADRALPAFYWTGETEMACIRETVIAARDHAYAHHIQRLMITGNLALLLGVAPEAVNDWYMVVFADAFEWVELPNTHGMALFADGGIVGSKPYAASGAYVNRMSDYCRTCAYDVNERLTDRACPLNALYWDFLIRNQARLAANPRMAMPYRTLERFDSKLRDSLSAKAEAVRSTLGAARVGS